KPSVCSLVNLYMGMVFTLIAGLPAYHWRRNQHFSGRLISPPLESCLLFSAPAHGPRTSSFVAADMSPL
ncbi:MAG: hypothetical protein ACREE6_08885, partial [Limisphaerales bacterium]